MGKFIFKGYTFDPESREAIFRYGFESGEVFEEHVAFSGRSLYDEALLDRALRLAFVLVGTSYYKTFPSTQVEFENDMALDVWQAEFFTRVYQEGLSQYASENKLTRTDLITFAAGAQSSRQPLAYNGSGVLALQSGGKDSLLTASFLISMNKEFIPWYVSSSDYHPSVLDDLEGRKIAKVRRTIDINALHQAAQHGGKNGHVPITYIVSSLAVIDAILSGAKTILISVGHEGEEPHGWIDDLPVNHQWSKTWSAEKYFADYVARYISPDIQVGSTLRGYSELRIAELFTLIAWDSFGHRFSSCNRANYSIGADNTILRWCGECPKCANTYLLFAPFLPSQELKGIFRGEDLFNKPLLTDIFKGLLGVDGYQKPFECVGEIGELRLAYHMAQSRGGYGTLPFMVSESSFDYKKTYDHQLWTEEYTPNTVEQGDD